MPKRDEKMLSLRHNSLWTLIGNGVFSACQWANIVFLAKLGNAEMVGQYALALAISAPAFEFANLQLRGVQATDARDDYRFGDYLGLRVTMIVVAVSVSALVSLLGGYGFKVMLLILAVAAAKVSDAMSDIFYGLFQKHERMKDMAVSLALRGIFALALLGTLLLITGDVVAAVLGMAAGWFAVFVLFDVRKGRSMLQQVVTSRDGISASAVTVRPILNRGRLTSLLLLSLPMGGVMMLSSLSVNVPRYFIEHRLGAESLGYFAAIYYIAAAGTMVVSSIGKTVSPRLAVYYAEGRLGAFRSLLVKLLLVASLMGGLGVAVAVLIGKEVLGMLYSAEYAGYTDIFAWLMVVAFASYCVNFLGNAVTSMRIFRVQFVVHLANVAAITTLCAVLIGPFGLAGASWAILAGMMFVALSYGFITLIDLAKKTEKMEGNA